MNSLCRLFGKKELTISVFLIFPVMVSAESTNPSLQKQIDDLKNQITTLNTEVQQATEWKTPNTLVHLAGYADISYVKKEGEDSSFAIGSFSPIFHYQYRDLIMMEAELEFEVDDTGSTSVAMEYMTIDWFMTDYATLVAGKFLTPIGQFRQNLHPSWINKLATAPPGFGHDGAAPLSDLGLQVRGGFPIAGMRANYAVYTSNGPELNAEAEDDGAGGFEYALDGVNAEGFNIDTDGQKTYGGRFAILPVSSFELGVSIVSGKASVTNIESVTTPPAGSPIAQQQARDYSVFGTDFVWFTGDISVRGEYVKSKVGADNSNGQTASSSATWTTWYTQAAYRLPGTKWEGVLRYADYDSPHANVDQTQIAIGINYLIANNFIAKLTYEFNDGNRDEITGVKYATNADLTELQLAYGF